MAMSGQTPKQYTGLGAFWVWVEWTATQSADDIANNRSQVTAITYGGSNEYGSYSGTNRWGYTTLDGTTTSQKATVPWNASTTKKELCRQTKTIAHNPDGTKSISISGRWTAGSSPEGSFFDLVSSGTFPLDTIPRASTPSLSASSVALGSPVTISTNRASTGFLHTIKYAIGSLNGTIASNVADSHAWTVPESLANAITTSTSGQVTITLETYSNGVLIGSKTIPLTVTVPNTATFKPTAAISSIVEGETGLTGFTVRVQNKSKLKVTSTGTGKYGATIAQYKVSIENANYYGALITSAVIAGAGTIPVTLTVTDSRGYTSSVTSNVTVIAYEPPKILTFSPRRGPTDQGADLVVPINFVISPVSNQNAKSYTIRYRQVGTGVWSTAVTSTSVYSLNTTLTYAGVLDPNFAYEVELVLTDSFNTSANSISKMESISTAFELVNYNASGKAIAFGKVSEFDNTMEVALPMRITGAVDFISSILFNGVDAPIPKRSTAYNFQSGHLIDTLQAPNNNKFFYLEIMGNGFATGIPIKTIVQFYWFTATPAFQFVRQLNLGFGLGTVSVFIHGGTIKIWVPYNVNPYTPLAFDLYMYSEMSPIPMSITNAAKPTTGVTYDTLATVVNGTSTPDVTALASGVDLSTVTKAGFYQLTATHGNMPPDGANGQMLVIRGAGNTAIQLLFPWNSNRIWRRSGDPLASGGWWRDWFAVGEGGGSAMTANEILTAIKTVDGSGSGLDADTLDGIHASAFAGIHLSRGGDHLNGWEDLPGNLRRCWKTVTFTLAGTAFTATGPTGTYKTGWLSLGTWPATFTGIPRLTNFTGTVTNGAWSWVGSIKEPTQAGPGDFLMYKFANTATDLKVFVEAVGPR